MADPTETENTAAVGVAGDRIETGVNTVTGRVFIKNRTTQPVPGPTREQLNAQRVEVQALLTRWIDDDGDAWDAACAVVATLIGGPGA